MATISITSDELDANNLKAIKTFLKTLKIKFEIANDFVSPQSISLTNEQKNILDERRANSNPEDFIPWEKAKKQLKFKGKKWAFL